MNRDAAPALYDAHNHLQDAWLAPHREQMWRDLEGIALRRAVVNGTAENDWADVAELARAQPVVRASFGLHPWNVGNASPHWCEHLEARLDADPHAGVGEIGLDRWILERARPDDSRLTGLRRASFDEQCAVFRRQLDIARTRGRAVTIHCLDAWGALAEVLKGAAPLERGFLLHAYAGSAEMGREFARLGGWFSFNGYFLGERQAAKRAVFKTLPLDRILVETDAPAMPLPPERRTHSLPGLADGNAINHPANIGAVYAGLADVLGMELEPLAAQVEKNFHALFGA